MKMKDLLFDYEDEDGVRHERSYLHIFDFTDEIEEKSETAPNLNGHNVNARFFENPMTAQHFDTVKDLYEHCKQIMK